MGTQSWRCRPRGPVGSGFILCVLLLVDVYSSLWGWVVGVRAKHTAQTDPLTTTNNAHPKLLPCYFSGPFFGLTITIYRIRRFKKTVHTYTLRSHAHTLTPMPDGWKKGHGGMMMFWFYFISHELVPHNQWDLHFHNKHTFTDGKDTHTHTWLCRAIFFYYQTELIHFAWFLHTSLDLLSCRNGVEFQINKQTINILHTKIKKKRKNKQI